MEAYEIEQTTDTGFRIENDLQADRQLERVSEARARYKHLCDHCDRQKELARQELQRIEGNAKALLMPYLDVVPAKRTKTQASYELPSGRLVLKHRGIEYKPNAEKLVSWMKTAGHADLVKTKTVETPNWAALKPMTAVQGGMVIMMETGEVVDGVEVANRDDELIMEV